MCLERDALGSEPSPGDGARPLFTVTNLNNKHDVKMETCHSNATSVQISCHRSMHVCARRVSERGVQPVCLSEHRGLLPVGTFVTAQAGPFPSKHIHAALYSAQSRHGQLQVFLKSQFLATAGRSSGFKLSTLGLDSPLKQVFKKDFIRFSRSSFHGQLWSRQVRQQRG